LDLVQDMQLVQKLVKLLENMQEEQSVLQLEVQQYLLLVVQLEK
jgi:hypothetical protein